MRRSGKRQIVEEETSERTSDAPQVHKVKRPQQVSSAARMMKPQTHPWLKWPGCDNNRKIELNNYLPCIVDKAMSSPRFVDWRMVENFGIEEELNEMFLTRYNEEFGPGPFEIRVWKKAFDVKEESYREWCLEFYASLEIDEVPRDHLIYNAKIIKFRLGGQEHEVTISQFGYLAGLFTREEAEDQDNMGDYELAGVWGSEEAKKRKNEIWNELSGKSRHTATSKATDIKDPILGLIQKMISYSFFHRSSHHDKVYEEDLWLLSHFARKDPESYVLAPWALVNYMLEKGGGRQFNGPMVCGHFVTRIAKNLGIASSAAINKCSPAVGWKFLTIQDLKKAGILNKKGEFVRVEGESSQQPSPPASPTRASGTLRQEIGRIGNQLDRVLGDLHGFGNYQMYHTQRYQPMWEHQFQQFNDQYGGSSSGFVPYQPPQMFPSYPPPQEEEAGDEEEED